jgi:hypothetical protein
LCKAATFSTPAGICGSVIFKHAFYSIPRMGTFILHDDLTPEYLGLHTTL